MNIIELLNKEREANNYLDKKGIKTACQHYRKLFAVDEAGNIRNLSEDECNTPNILYVGTKKSMIGTPVTEESLERVKTTGQLLAEIPFEGEGGWSQAIIRAAEVVKAKLGAVTLADVVDISYADKGEIRKLITRIKKSSKDDELKARGEELADIISQYEDRQNDTENETLEEKFQNILDLLETAQQDLEAGNKEACIDQLEDALLE